MARRYVPPQETLAVCHQRDLCLPGVLFQATALSSNMLRTGYTFDWDGNFTDIADDDARGVLVGGTWG